MKELYSRIATTEQLRNIILKGGATVVGFGNVSAGLAKELNHLPVAISIAIKHAPVEIIKTTRVIAYSNQLTPVDLKLEQIQKTVVAYLKSTGYKCLAIPPDSMRVDSRFIARLYPLFPHKTAATCAGLGWIGKSGLLINRRYGARLSWATVLTNAPLEVTPEPYTFSHCGNCLNCVKNCPAGAIEDWQWIRGVNMTRVNYTLCGEYLERNKQLIGKAICGICVMVCPKGRNS